VDRGRDDGSALEGVSVRLRCVIQARTISFTNGFDQKEGEREREREEDRSKVEKEEEKKSGVASTLLLATVCYIEGAQ
jgi:hypothetical protein